MKSKSNLAKNSVIFAISTFGSKILIFLLLPLYTRVLTKEEFGSIDAIISAINLIVPLATLCVGDALLRFGKEKNSDKSVIFSSSFLIYVISVFLVIIVATILKFSLNNENINNYFVYFLVLYIVDALNILLINFAKSQDKIFVVGINGILQTVILVTLNILFLLVFDMGIMGYFLATIISFLVSSIYLFISTKIPKFMGWKKISWPIIKVMLIFSIPILPNAISWWINNMATRYIVIAYLGIGALGILSAAYKIPTILSTIYSVFTQAWQLEIIEEIDSEGVDDYFNQVQSIFTTIMVFLSLGVIIGSQFLGKLIFDKEFIDAVKYIPLLILSTFFGGISVVSGMVFIAKKDTKTLFISTIIGAAISVAIGFILIPKIGLFGATVATAIAYFFIWLIRQIKILKYIRIKKDYSYIFNILIFILACVMITLNNDYFYYVTIFCAIILLFVNYENILIIIKTTFEKARKFLGRA